MSAQHERNRAVHAQADGWRKEGLIDAATQQAVVAALPMPWRSYGIIAQGVFFLLTLVGMGAAYGFSAIIELPLRGVWAGIAFLVAGELLIRRNWFGTGVEAALWIGGLFSIISELPSSGKPEAMLVIAGVCGLAGARLRNPIFGTAAAIFIVLYAEKKADLGVVTALVIALLAVVALLREWRRPSTEWLWILLALALPIAGRFCADEEWWRTTIILYAAFGLIALLLAIVRRHHALFFAGAIGLVIATGDIAERIAWPAEAKLAAGGTFLLGLAMILSRVLRSRTRGLVVTPAKLTAADDAIAIAGALIASRASQADAPPESTPADTRPQGDGGFGGAGATGSY